MLLLLLFLMFFSVVERWCCGVSGPAVAPLRCTAGADADGKDWTSGESGVDVTEGRGGSLPSVPFWRKGGGGEGDGGAAAASGGEKSGAGAAHLQPETQAGVCRQVNGGLDCPTQHAAAVTLARTSGLRNEQIKIKEIYNKITNCPCNFGVEFGWVTLLGPIVIFFVLLSIIASDACRARCGHSKGKRLLRYSALTIVASVAWGSVALLNSEAVCCIQGGYPSDSPCLVGRNATANAVRYEDCTSDSEVAGVRLLMYGGSIFSVILAFIAITFGLKWLLKKQNVPNQSEVP